jgi:hypothetical protein
VIATLTQKTRPDRRGGSPRLLTGSLATPSSPNHAGAEAWAGVKIEIWASSGSITPKIFWSVRR